MRPKFCGKKGENRRTTQRACRLVAICNELDHSHQSRCVSCIVHSRQITSHVFHTHVTSHTIRHKTRANLAPTRTAHSFTTVYNRARSTTRYLSIQYSEHSGQTREKQKAKRVKHSHRAAGGAAGSCSWRRRQETSDISRYRRESSIPCGVRVAAALVGAGSPR